MTSKELLSEVLNGECFDITQTTRGVIEVGYSTKDSTYNFINIHELAHKCKEWAGDKYGYDISSGKAFGENVNDKNYAQIFERGGCECKETLISDTEPEAIFKACEWILNDRR